MVSTSDSDSDNLSSNLSRTSFLETLARQDKTFPRVPLPPSLLEFMHGVADGLGYLVMVLGYGELFYNSTSNVAQQIK